jgi:OFA family oxalate/formate antiporter-like MFS transporter
MPSSKRPHIFRGWWIVATGFLSQMVIIGATGWVLSVQILPMQHSLGWSRSELVGPLTIFSLLAGTLSAALGPMMDRYGVRAVMAVSALLAGACLIALGHVTAPWQFYLLFGAGLGLAAPALQYVGPSVAISNWFIRRRNRAFASFTLGSATAGIILAPLIGVVTHTLGWRAGWAVMGGLGWCIVPLAWFAVRRTPEEVGLLPDGDTRRNTPAEAPPAGAAPAPDEVVWRASEALRTRAFWLLTVGFALTNLPSSSIYVHMAPYFSSKGLPAAAGVVSLSIYGFGVLAGRFIWAFAIGRLGMHRALTAYGFTYGLAIVAFLAPSGLLALYAMTILLGVSVAGSQQLQPQAFADYFGRRIVGSLLGYAGLLFMVSRAAAPVFAAVLFDRLHSYLIPFSFFALACFAAGGAFVFASPPHRADGEQSAERRGAGFAETLSP